MMTVLHGLLTALAWPVALLAATEFIDSTWTIAIDRFFFLLVVYIEVLLIKGRTSNLCSLLSSVSIVFIGLQIVMQLLVSG